MNLQLFWLFRVCREPSPKARECYDKIMNRTDKTYFVWKEGENFNHIELLPIEYDRNNQNEEISFDIISILEKRSLLGEDEFVN